MMNLPGKRVLTGTGSGRPPAGPEYAGAEAALALSATGAAVR